MDCKICGINFKRNIDLENHIRLSHEEYPVLQCDECDKSFLLMWRLKKHTRLHTEKNVLHCHYFNNNKNCPFEEHGCKFLHAVSKNCQFGRTCRRRLCPCRHPEANRHVVDDPKSDVDEETNEMDESHDTTNHYSSFVTSTPRNTIYQCEECGNQSQCTDCFVRQTLMTNEKSHRVHFPDEI